MRMLRIALVLIVLASFLVATAAVSTAATDTQTAMKAPAMPMAPKMPTKKPGQMIDLKGMKTNIGNTYQMLKSGVKMPGAVVNGPGASVKTKVNGMVSDTYGQIAQGRGKSLALGVPAPQAISQLGGLPKIGNMASMGKVPGMNQMVSLGL